MSQTPVRRAVGIKTPRGPPSGQPGRRQSGIGLQWSSGRQRGPERLGGQCKTNACSPPRRR